MTDQQQQKPEALRLADLMHAMDYGDTRAAAADNYDWHLLHAAYQAGMHAQLADARNRAMRLADAYAVMDIETEGIKAVGPSEWLITHDSLCDKLTADSIEHLRYRRLALIDDADGGLLVHLKTDA